ncbi:MAG TPA: methyltransferase domain-containing protein [Noviherbaspirillum sp.]|jgi:SAM-dependent methyltransferase|uniref:class I SAM-dependent DNA methyltransferase n=1 Tax=Noviherbaspirillum sp. TaxID=1926288 RepID=UPI002F95AAF6
MQHAGIASAYDRLAERWLDERFSRTDGVHQHKRALNFLADGAGGRALNVGCGCNTRFNALMHERGLEIEGIDISARMVALAEAADPAVTVHHADVCTWQPQHRYHFITAWDSIWHVRLEHQRALMLKLMGALEAGGVFIFSAGGLDEAGEHVDSAMGPEVYYSTLGIPGLLDAVSDAGCVCRHLEFDQHPQKHLCVIVQRLFRSTQA